MACSNIMGGSVTTPRSGNIAFSLHNYMIFIKTRLLFPLHIQLFHTPPLIYEPYYLLFSPAYGRQEYWPPLLCHRKVKYLPPGNLLWHTDVLFGDILPNRLHPFVHYRLTNRGVLPSSITTPKHPDISPSLHPILENPQIPQNTGGDKLQLWSK